MTQRPSHERLEEIRQQVIKRHFGWPQELLAEIDALRAELAITKGQRDDESGVLSLVAEERDELRALEQKWQDTFLAERHDFAVMCGHYQEVLKERDSLKAELTVIKKCLFQMQEIAKDLSSRLGVKL